MSGDWLLGLVVGLGFGGVLPTIVSRITAWRTELAQLRASAVEAEREIRSAQNALNASHAALTQVRIDRDAASARELKRDYDYLESQRLLAAEANAHAQTKRVLVAVVAGIPAASPEWTPAEAAAIREARELIARQQATA